MFNDYPEGQNDVEKELLLKTKELFNFIEEQKKLQFELIGLVKNIDDCPEPDEIIPSISNREDNDLKRSIDFLTDEVRRSNSYQKQIEENLNEYLCRLRKNDFPRILSESIQEEDPCCNEENELCLGIDELKTIPVMDYSKSLERLDCDDIFSNSNRTPTKIQNSLTKQKSKESKGSTDVSKKERENIPCIPYKSLSKSPSISVTECEEESSDSKIKDCLSISKQNKKSSLLQEIYKDFNEIVSERTEKKSSCGYSTLRNDFCSISKPSLYIYVIDDLQDIYLNEIENWSDSFYTSHLGYRLKCKIGFSQDFIGIFVKMVKGDFDNLLAWPFRNEIEFTLLNQVEEGCDISRTLKPHPNDCDEYGYWLKPDALPCTQENLPGWGLCDFISRKCLLGPSDDFVCDFVRNDRIYIKIRIKM